MNLKLFLAVIWRFKVVFIAGLILASALAVFSYGTPHLVGTHLTILPRGAQEWQAQSEFLVTQSDFPEGNLDQVNNANFAGLTPVYAALANGATIQAEVRKAAGVPHEQLQAIAAVDEANGVQLPLVTLNARATTSAGASKVAGIALRIVQQYVSAQEVAAAIPSGKRVVLQTVNPGYKSTLATAPKKTMSVLAFLVVIALVVGLIFALENLNPKTAKALEQRDERHSTRPDSRAASIAKKRASKQRLTVSSNATVTSSLQADDIESTPAIAEAGVSE